MLLAIGTWDLINMQGNLYNPKVYVYFTIFAFPVAAAIALCLDPIFSWIGFSETAKIVLGTPTGIGLLFSILNIFDKYAWKWSVFRWFGIVTIPNLEGRWKGTIESSYNGSSTHEAILEICQTFSKIGINLYTATSESRSLIAGFSKDEGGQIRLYYLYQNTPHLIRAASTMISQQGSAVLKILKKGKLLDGCYYNSGRERNTFGELKFEWVQKERVDSFIVDSAT